MASGNYENGEHTQERVLLTFIVHTLYAHAQHLRALVKKEGAETNIGFIIVGSRARVVVVV